MLLQIHEPGQTPLPHAEESGVAVGIDLGTTNSVIAFSLGQRVAALRNDQGSALIPSVVAYAGSDRLVGQEAVHKLSDSTWTTIKSIKRFMGSRSSVKAGAKELTAVEISSHILSYLKKQAEDLLKQKVDRAVITVPAYFDDAARTATRDAARLSGLQVLRLINEPTAAALAYGLNTHKEGIYIIYDLGGGTFDVSLLHLQKGIFQVIATGGDTQLGGDDFDEIILKDSLEKNSLTQELFTPHQWLQALNRVRHVKESLSLKSSASWSFALGKKIFTQTLTHESLNQLIGPWIDQTIDLCKQVLQDAHMSMDQVQGMVLVGGSTRIPLIKEKLTACFGEKILDDIDPDEVVAAGAALQAEALTSGSDTLLLDVTPLSLGLETFGGLVEKIIHRNTPTPIAKAQDFTTYQDGQTAMIIHVIQGERELVQDCRSLGRFELRGIPPMVAGAARIRVTFSMDADGILSVEACETTTQTRQAICIVPSYGIDQEEMIRLLKESIENGESDMSHRLALEAQVDALRVLYAVEIALKNDGDLLEAAEKKELLEGFNNLQNLKNSFDRDSVVKATKRLEQLSEPFAQKRLSRTITGALQA